MLSFSQAMILGILQGISELFPISSLAHSIILPALIGWSVERDAGYFLTFLVATHFATAAVLFVIYSDDWIRIGRGLLRSIVRRSVDGDFDAKLGWLLVLGTIPAGIIGLILEKHLQKLFASPGYVAAFLIFNGLLLYFAERLRKRAKTVVGIKDADQRIALEVSWWQSIKVGTMQVLALIPGFSRTGSTLAGGLLIGLAHEDALRFSFLLATPIIGAAAALKLPALLASHDPSAIKAAVLGGLGAALASYFSVKFLTRYFKSRTLTPFAIYCLLVGFLSLAILHR
jgi:undecaprenyl-diphosphatase